MATSVKKTKKVTTPKKAKTSQPKLSSRIKLSRPNIKFPPVNVPKVVTVLVIVGIAALLYFFQDKYLFAKVNGKPLSTFAVLKELEQVKQNEVSEVVNIMIDKSLILQEAEKRGITIPESEIDAEIKKTEEQLKQSGQTLDSQLALLGLTREGLRENYRIQKSIEKMIGETKVTDKEIAAYIEENKDVLPQDQDEKQIQTMVREQLSQQKLGEKYQNFISELRNKADITTFRPYLNQAPIAQ